MPFREKSAWIMSAALLLGGLLYFGAVLSVWSKSGQLISPVIPKIVVYTVVLTVIAIIGHVIIAATAPADANAPVDERERQIIVRAGHFSSYVFGFGVIVSLGSYLIIKNGDLLFYLVFASLMVGQLAEYLFQILFFRTTL